MPTTTATTAQLTTLEICGDCAVNLSTGGHRYGVADERREQIRLGRERVTSITWETGVTFSGRVSEFGSHNWIHRPAGGPCDICGYSPSDGSRWTAYVVLGTPAPAPTETMRNRIRLNSSALRTTCHNAQHANTRDGYQTALTGAREMVANLENAIAAFDQQD